MSEPTKPAQEHPFAASAGSARKCHTLKIAAKYLDAIGDGMKPFEVRKFDRDFRVGDILHLREWDGMHQSWGYRWIACFITYILSGNEATEFGVMPGYCVLGIKLPANHCWPPNAKRSATEAGQ